MTPIQIGPVTVEVDDEDGMLGWLHDLLRVDVYYWPSRPSDRFDAVAVYADGLSRRIACGDEAEATEVARAWRGLSCRTC